jgi:hypothetical protein
LQSTTGGQRVVLGAGAPRRGRHEHPGPRGADEGLAGAGERLAERPHGRQVTIDGAGVVPGPHGVVLEREMDDPVGGGGGFAQAVQIVEITESGLGAEGFQGGGCRLGAGQTDDLVAGGEKFGDDGRADVAGRSGNEDTHGKSLLDLGSFPSDQEPDGNSDGT